MGDGFGVMVNKELGGTTIHTINDDLAHVCYKWRYGIHTASSGQARLSLLL